MMLRHKTMVLVHPSTWEDPWEFIGSCTYVSDNINGKRRLEPLTARIANVFAQCWSSTKESDTLLRAYSRVIKHPKSRRNVVPRREEGVWVCSSARKLLAALEEGTKEGTLGHCYIDSVAYMEPTAQLHEIRKIVHKFGKDIFDRPNTLTRLALLKRAAFSHESEVRLILVSDSTTPGTKFIPIPIDPNSVFDEVAFDPSLEEFERKERSLRFNRLGYYKIVPWYLYMPAEQVIDFSGGIQATKPTSDSL